MSIVGYRQEREITDFFVKLLEDDLAGRRKPRIVNRMPVDACHLGVLGPFREEIDEVDPNENGEPAEAESAAESRTNLTPGPDTRPTRSQIAEGDDKGDGPAPEPAPEGREARDFVRRPPSSIGMEFILQSETKTVELDIACRFAIYTPHLPTLEEQRVSLGGEVQTTEGTMSLADVWERQNIEICDLHMTIPTDRPWNQKEGDAVQAAVERALDRALSAPDAMPAFEARPKMDLAAVASPEVFRDWLAAARRGLPTKRPPIRVSLTVETHPLGANKTRVAVYLTNDTLRGKTRTEDNYNILADALIKARITQGTLNPIEILPVPADYQYDRRVWAIGHNASVDVDENRITLQTRTLALFQQVRLITQNHAPARFKDVAAKPLEVLESIRQAMEEYAARWYQEAIVENGLRLDKAALDECRKDLDNFRGEIQRFCNGLAAIQRDQRLLQAFQAMNRIMERLAKGYDSWRLFQIVFIVTQLPAIAIREGIVDGEYPAGVRRQWDDELAWADVLWFPTGGGKTEAYFGLVSCAILYDRLRGKKLGLTAWLRFPLRMLSVQQLQRAIRMIWETEVERKFLLGVGHKDSDPVSLGYLIGSTTTPNRLDERFFREHQDAGACERFRVVADCPACHAEGSVRVIPDAKNFRLPHVCQKCQTVLPLFVSDSEIYRFLPALIVGTVDKMATVGAQVRFGILWSGPRWKCIEHGYNYGEYCEVYSCTASKDKRKRQIVTPYDPAPTFHVQDELHLLQEELGAFAGHYETLIRFCEKSAGGHPAKVIAATATIEGYEHQVRHLYGVKGGRRFPGRGYKRHESFYSAIDLDPDDQAAPKIARIFLAFRPPAGNAADVAAKCTEVLHEAIATMIQNPYAGLAALPSVATPEGLLDLLRYYSSTLTYVNSLHNGTRIKDCLRNTSEDVHRGVRNLNVEYLSSRSTTGEVSEVIHRMEEPPPWEHQEYLDAVVATNMISHGVDLDRINLMIMDRFPAEAAEYIQASSRSGRRKIGLVVVVLPAYNLRAASIYHRFKEYHQHLDRMVAPVPVNRFAKYAVSRTLPGIVSGLLFGLVCPQENSGSLSRRRPALDWIHHDPSRIDALLQAAYAMGQGLYEKELEEFYIQAIKEQYGKLLAVLQASMEERLTEAMRPRPMTSLRDVERGVPFRMGTSDFLVHAWFRKRMD